MNLCKLLEESWWSLTGSRALNLSISTFTTSYFCQRREGANKSFLRAPAFLVSYHAGSHYHCGCHHLWPNGLVVRCSLWVMLRPNTFASGPGFEPLLGPILFFPAYLHLYYTLFRSISAQVNAESIRDAPEIVRNKRLRYHYATRAARDAKCVPVRQYAFATATVDRKRQQSKFPLDGAHGPQR